MTEQAAVKRDDMFTISKESEIRAMIRRLIAQHCLFTAHFGDEHRFLLTTLLGVSENGREMFLDVSPHESINQRVLAAPSLLMSTQIDRVELRFRTARVTEATFEGLPAFRVPLPEQMLYLQWREFFRLTPPISRPVICEIQVPAGEETHVLQTRVIDISVGGVAIHVPTEFEPAFHAGAQFEHCRLDLPDTGVIRPTLLVRYVVQTADARGQLRMRAGCQFHNPPRALQSTVQRYVTRVERERIARSQGVL